MAVLTVRNLPDEVHRALRVRAAESGRSMEAEVRDILTAAARPANRVLLGDAMAALGKKIRLTDQEFALLDSARDRQPAEPWSFDR